MIKDITKKDKSERTLREKLIISFYENFSMFAVGVVAVMLIFSFGFRVSGIEGTSMLPTLEDGDRVVLTAFDGKPERGQVVIITQPNAFGKPVVKRIIATENQTVHIDFTEGRVFVDGEELYEPYINNLTIVGDDVNFPVTVPEGHVFVLGDNRQGSTDSRSTKIGFINENYIMGVVKYRFANINEDTSEVSLIDFENMKVN